MGNELLNGLKEMRNKPHTPQTHTVAQQPMSQVVHNEGRTTMQGEAVD